MQEKQIHIVFQVLNFISGEESESYNISSAEQLLLIMMAKHRGKRGIYPSQATLSKELKCSDRYIRKLLTKLISKKLIHSSLNPGSSNDYHLTLPGMDLSTTPEPEFHPSRPTPEPEFLPPRNKQVATPEPEFLQSDTKSIQRNKSERERSLIFEPDEGNRILCSDLRLDLREQLESFRHRHRGVKTQYEFSRWLKSSKEYATKQANNEVRSTVQWWGEGHPSYDALHGNKTRM
jgi:hypothetical protein